MEAGKRIAYISHPFRDSSERRVLVNVCLACWFGYRAYLEGYDPYIPHLNIILFGMMYPDRDLSYEPAWMRREILSQDLRWIKRSDVVIFCGSRMSEGMRIEKRYAKKLGKPILYRRTDGEINLREIARRCAGNDCLAVFGRD